ncbi:MAG: ATP-binding protein [Bacteroidales bacterium]|nr:ATP-binding protein [Bacteroidales bacterium]
MKKLDKVSLRDGMQLMLQHERDTRQANRIARLIKNAGFRQKSTIEELEMDTTRGLSTADVAEQATGGYIRDGRFTIVIGPTGTGKTFLLCALGERACRQGYKTLYFTMNTLIDQLRRVHLEGRETNFFRKLSAHDLLIIDDFGMVRLEGQIQHEFEQIIDDRYNRMALILASQLPVADWYNVFQSELIDEACLDRLVHKSKRFLLKGESLRK